MKLEIVVFGLLQILNCGSRTCDETKKLVPKASVQIVRVAISSTI